MTLGWMSEPRQWSGEFLDEHMADGRCSAGLVIYPEGKLNWAKPREFPEPEAQYVCEFAVGHVGPHSFDVDPATPDATQSQ